MFDEISFGKQNLTENKEIPVFDRAKEYIMFVCLLVSFGRIFLFYIVNNIKTLDNCNTVVNNITGTFSIIYITDLEK